MTEDEERYKNWRYQKNIPHDRDFLKEAWHLLETYSHVPADQVEQHITEIREKAFAIHPYPCIGRWRFLNLYLTRLPIYPEIIARISPYPTTDVAQIPAANKKGNVASIRHNQTFLDAGCAFGQILRQVAVDSNCPQTNLYGADLRRSFIDLGYDLFKDRDTFKAHFYVGNMLSPSEDGQLAAGLDGKIDIIHAASLFHLFGWDDQITLGKRLIKFLKPEATEALIVGRQVGTQEPMDLDDHRREVKTQTGEPRLWRYLHDPDSWQRLWDVLGEETGTKWKAESELTEFFPEAGEDEGIKRTGMVFVVRRIG